MQFRHNHNIPSRIYTGEIGEGIVVNELLLNHFVTVNMNKRSKIHPYDLLVNGKVKIDVKTATEQRRHFVFALSEKGNMGHAESEERITLDNGRTRKLFHKVCDFLILCGIAKGKHFLFIVPASEIPDTQQTITITNKGFGKWWEWHERFELLRRVKMAELAALVKFNNSKAFVLKDKVKLRYTRHGNILIGIDDSGTFVDCLYYETPHGAFRAFAGREFDIPLENGEVIHCNGQWWQGGAEKAEEILGKNLVSATYGDMESLRKCYVYTGYCAIKEKLEELEATYNGKLYEYYEYEKVLKESYVTE